MKRAADQREATAVGIYVHIPFCLSKCAYCDFVSFATGPASSEHRAAAFDRYVSALVREIEAAPRRPVGTIYFGGGTPTVLGPERLRRILETIAGRHSLLTAEITCEANPDTVDVTSLRAAGFNRLSIGVQSLDEDVLAVLGRTHDATSAKRAVESAREAGFDNVSVDLIFGSPGESLDSWRGTLRQAVALGPDHISAYCLTLEEGTPLARRVAAGELAGPDEDLAADMMETAHALLTQAGYEHYEISNFARPGKRCAHNVDCWNYRDYLGFGAAAHSKLDGTRFANVDDVDDYVAALRKSGATPSGTADPVSRRVWTREQTSLDKACEATILGLRTTEGIPRAHLNTLWDNAGIDIGPRLRKFESDGLLEAGERTRLTDRGIALANEVFREFV